jgi:hypothetical protein
MWLISCNSTRFLAILQQVGTYRFLNKSLMHYFDCFANPLLQNGVGFCSLFHKKTMNVAFQLVGKLLQSTGSLIILVCLNVLSASVSFFFCVKHGRGALYCFAESNKSGNAQSDLLSIRLVLKDETI